MGKRKNLIHFLPEFGSMATGTLYLSIGVVALLSFFKVRNGGADESSIMAVLNNFFLGKILVLLILFGTACYVAWRVYEVVTDPYHYGRSWNGVFKRAGIALSTITDALVLIAGVRVLLGVGEIQSNGQPVEERAMAHSLLDAGYEWVVILIGVATFATAVIQLIYGFTRGYRERVDEYRFNGILQVVFRVLGLYGYGARSFILGIIGFFFLKAGVLRDGEIIVNTDKAFDFIGDNMGHAFFIITAGGTIAYGCFMFALGVTYKPLK